MNNSRHYEVVFLVNPNLGVQVSDLIKRYQDVITKGGGKVHRLENWGRQPLAYPIKKITKANYVLLNIECNNKVLDELNYDFRFNDAILRKLVLQREYAITDKSPLLEMIEAQAKAEAHVSSSAEK